jgi:hypothetical protein
MNKIRACTVMAKGIPSIDPLLSTKNMKQKSFPSLHISSSGPSDEISIYLACDCISKVGQKLTMHATLFVFVSMEYFN